MEDRKSNEEMRHVPSADEISRRLETSFRKRLLLLAEVADKHRDAEHLRKRLISACHWLGCIAEVCNHRQHVHRDEHGSLSDNLEKSLRAAIAGLQHVDADLFRRRMPYHDFQRSEGERVTVAMVCIGSLIEEAASIAATLDRSIIEKFCVDDLGASPRGVEDFPQLVEWKNDDSPAPVIAV